MKIDSSKILVTLKDEPYKDVEGSDLTVGAVIAEALASYTVGGKQKLYTLAKSFFKGETVEASEDMELIKQALEACTTYNTIIIGQTLGYLE